MERKVLLIMADQCEEGEVAEILDIMRRAGFACDGVSIAGEYVTGQHGVRILADSIMKEDISSYKDYDCLILYFSSRQNQPSHPYQLQAVGDIIAQSYAHYLAGKQKPGE